MQQVLGFFQTTFGAILLTIWVLPWKGYALWKAAGKKEKWWFIALLVLNTVGIFEILYIFVFSEMRKNWRTQDEKEEKKIEKKEKKEEEVKI
jgi:hypothetical protein